MKYHSLDFCQLGHVDKPTGRHCIRVGIAIDGLKTQDQVHQIGVGIDLILKMTALDQGKESIPGNDPPLELVVSHPPVIGGN